MKDGIVRGTAISTVFGPFEVFRELESELVSIAENRSSKSVFLKWLWQPEHIMLSHTAGFLKIGPEHRVWTETGLVNSSTLRAGDYVLGEKGTVKLLGVCRKPVTTLMFRIWSDLDKLGANGILIAPSIECKGEDHADEPETDP